VASRIYARSWRITLAPVTLRQRAFSAWRVRQRVVALAMKCIAAGCINERRIVASANVVMAWHQ
jgi:hypothetical protein